MTQAVGTRNTKRAVAPRIEAVSDLILIAGGLRPKSVIIAGGDREEDLLLVESARDHGIVERCILVGDGAAIRRAADAVGIHIAPDDVIATADQAQTAQRTVEMVQQGQADIILKGNISTPILNRAMMRIVVRETMSLVTMFDAAPIRGGRPMLMTDPGVTTVLNYGRMVGLIENAVDVAHSIMGIKRPRVAVLSANEKIIDSMPSTAMGKALSEHAWDGAVVYGPLSFDLAVSDESVRLKGLPGSGAAREVCGQADILVCPSIDAANILYKVIGEVVKFGLGTFAGVTVGVAVPYVILSRGDNVETKLQSIALSSIASERMDMAAHRAARRGAHAPHVSAGGAEPSAALQGVLAAARTAAGKMRVPAQRVNYVVAYVSDAAREVTVAALRHARVVDSVVLPHAGHGAGFEHMSGAIARAIGSMCVPVGPDCEGILLAGDAAASEPLVRALKAAVSHLAPVSTVKPAPEAPRAARQQ